MQVICYSKYHEDSYKITYAPKTKFAVHMNGRDLECVKRKKTYVADIVSLKYDLVFRIILFSCLKRILLLTSSARMVFQADIVNQSGL